MSSPGKRNTEREGASLAAQAAGDESVEDLLANVDQFIEGIYRDINFSPTRLTAIRNINKLRATKRNNDSSGSSLNASSLMGRNIRNERTPATSPLKRRNMDAEIARINQICNDVDQNLRSVGLFMSSPVNSENSGDIFHTNLPSPPTTSSIEAVSPPLSTIIRKFNKQSNLQRLRSSPAREVDDQFVDLSNSQTESSVHHSNNVGGEDDDVIVVSSTIPPVIDLCTPNGRQEISQSRRTINYQQLNRRNLSRNDEGPSLPRRRRTMQLPSEYNKNSGNTEVTSNNTLLASNSDGREPFMCAVCMDSCLNKYPTSTICGHVFCKRCIEQAIAVTRKCPICNKKITKKHTFRIFI